MKRSAAGNTALGVSVGTSIIGGIAGIAAILTGRVALGLGLIGWAGLSFLITKGVVDSMSNDKSKQQPALTK